MKTNNKINANILRSSVVALLFSCTIVALCWAINLRAQSPAILASQDRAGRTATPTCTPPSDMAGWWKFEETSGTIAYDEVGGNDGTYIDSPIPTTGRVGNAL